MLEVRVTTDAGEVAKRFLSIDMHDVIGNAVSELAGAILRQSKPLVPVDTGRLRASIRWISQLGGLRQEISTNTEYARFVHDGTWKMRGRPFFEWGTDRAITNFGNSQASQIVDRELAKRLKTL